MVLREIYYGLNLVLLLNKVGLYKEISIFLFKFTSLRKSTKERDNRRACITCLLFIGQYNPFIMVTGQQILIVQYLHNRYYIIICFN